MIDGGISGLLADLRSTLVGALEVAEACLQFATQASTTPGYVFNSSRYRGLDVKTDIDASIPGSISSFLDPAELEGVAAALERSMDSSLAAWYVAFRIARSISQDFSAHLTDKAGASVFTLEDLAVFCIPPEACSALYGSRSFRERDDVDRYPFEPSHVPGLALWRTGAHHPYSVVVDTEAGGQFNAALNDHDGSLSITLIQPNSSIVEIFIDDFAPPEQSDRRFFGVRPLNRERQRETISDAISRAADPPAGIVLLPELVTTESDAKAIGEQISAWAATGDTTTLPRVIIGGSYHHEEKGIRRNTTKVHFPSGTGPPVADRTYSKSAAFFMDFPAEVLEYLTQHSSQYTGDVHFREDVEPSTEVRLYLGDSFSAIVAICSDLLDRTFLDVIRRLRPSLVLVCNMTYKSEGFISIAHSLISHSQTTTVMVNNPGTWWAQSEGAPLPPDGVIIGMPLAGSRILTHSFNGERLVRFTTGEPPHLSVPLPK